MKELLMSISKDELEVMFDALGSLKTELETMQRGEEEEIKLLKSGLVELSKESLDKMILRHENSIDETDMKLNDIERVLLKMFKLDDEFKED